MDSIITPELIKIIAKNYALDIKGRHGIIHWARVRYNALILAQDYNINKDILEYFAILHDSKRENEAMDKDHGKRSAKFIETIRKYVLLEENEFSILLEACIGHNKIKFHENDVIKICWDADRLDILRAGIHPSPDFMNTETAKKNTTIKEANERSTANFKPEILDYWLKFI